ncbi:MAG: YhjD/YihY/BrkB family envelope integrity protein [Actinomycetes bacterium]
MNRAPHYLVRIVTRTLTDLQRIDPFDRAMTLSAQAFTSLFPLVIAAVSFLRRGDAETLSDQLSHTMSLPPSTQAVLDETLAPANQQLAAFGVVSLLIVLLSATSFSRALTRMYARAWDVQPPGWTGGWRWIAVIVGVATCTLALQSLHRAAQGEVYETFGALLLTGVVNAVLWTWVPWLLLARRVSWLLLLPGGLLMGVGSIGTFLGSRVYMPLALGSASRQFGALGVAFTYISWLFVVSFVLIFTTVLGAVLARDESVSARFGGHRLATGTAPEG